MVFSCVCVVDACVPVMLNIGGVLSIIAASIASSLILFCHPMSVCSAVSVAFGSPGATSVEVLSSFIFIWKFPFSSVGCVASGCPFRNAVTAPCSESFSHLYCCW